MRDAVSPWWLAAVLLAVAPLVAQQTPASSTATGDKKGQLEGTVLHAVSKEPVRRAEVILSPIGRPQTGPPSPDGPPGSRRTATDHAGKFAFAGVEPGRYRLAAEKSGFVRGSFGARAGRGGLGRGFSTASVGATIDIGAGQTIADARIELMPQGVIAGRVVDEEGEPLQNLFVQALGSRYLRGKRQMLPVGGTQTNDKGEYRITNLMPGKVVLQVSPGRWSGSSQGVNEKEPDMAYVPTYFPGVTEQAQAMQIDVGVGAELSGFDLRLQKARVTRVRGRALDASGQPARNSFVTLLPAGAGFSGPLVMSAPSGTSDKGEFDLRNVQPGSYTLMVQGRQGGRMGGPHREPITVGPYGIDDLTVQMAPPFSIEGRIVAKPGVTADLSSVRVQLNDEYGRMFGSMMQQAAKEDGSFTLDNTTPGQYSVNVTLGSQSALYVQAIRYGDQDVLGTDFVIASGGVPLEVVIDSGAATVSGNAIDQNAPASGVTVVLLPAEKTRRSTMFIKTASTDQNGAFTVSGVAPGEYLAFAFDDVEFGAWEDVEFLKQVESKAVKVKATKNASTTIALPVTSAPQ